MPSAVNLFMAAQSPAMRQALTQDIDARATDAETARKRASMFSLGATDAPACKALLDRMEDYPHRRDVLGGALYDRLATAYAVRRGGAEAVRREVQRQDMVVGCMKSKARQGARDVDSVHAGCECNIEAFTSSTTLMELDDFLASTRPDTSAEATRAYLARQPWFKVAKRAPFAPASTVEPGGRLRRVDVRTAEPVDPREILGLMIWRRPRSARGERRAHGQDRPHVLR